MSHVLDFFVPQLPKQKGNNKRLVHFGGKPRLIGSKKALQAEKALAARVLEHRPPEPFSGPVRLDVTFFMPIPKSWPKWKQEAARNGRYFHVTRPDRGNLLKLVEDALEGPFYLDDSQICLGVVGKAYADVPGYRIRLEELSQAEREGA